MVARIRSGKSLKGAVNYNEMKVSKGKAELIEAKGYPKAFYKLNFHEKLNRLQRLADLNLRTSTNCVHLSLNFDPKEKVSSEKVREIASAYMQGIGFGNQPYLVYKHMDAAHPHIHIVTTNIQKDGQRISLHNLGQGLSEITRKEIEVRFGLIRAGKKQETEFQSIKPASLSKALYGKTETKRAITNVVNAVLNQYKFVSFPEFNAILQQFGVMADRGEKDTRMFEKGGLQYSLINDRQQKIGVPIKASQIYGSPILKEVESKYEDNKRARQIYKNKLRELIIKLQKTTHSKHEFTEALKARGIDIVFRTNDQNFIYGVTYVDHQTKTVFNGSDLGKELSAAALRSQWEKETNVREHQSPTNSAYITRNPFPPSAGASESQSSTSISEQVQSNSPIFDILTNPTASYDYVPHQLKKKKRKKKGKQL